MAKLLLVDDDSQLLSTIAKFLQDVGHTVDLATSGEDALQLLSLSKFDVIFLDWLLPGISGRDVCTKFRASGGQTPIIFLTGKDDINSLEEALDSGADDYINKPFDIRELNARLKSILKRRQGEYMPSLTVGGLTLDPERQVITSVDASFPAVRLRAKESALLAHLMRNPNKIFSANDLLEACWATDAEASSNSVRTWIGLLRNKLAEVGKPDLVRTVLGSGYTIDSPKN